MTTVKPICRSIQDVEFDALFEQLDRADAAAPLGAGLARLVAYGQHRHRFAQKPIRR